MANIQVTRDSRLIKVLAAQARYERVDSDLVKESADIISELAQDLNPQNQHEIAQIIGYTVDELQPKALDFLNLVADIKNIGYGDKAAFKVSTGGIKAYIQAKGSTTARSYVADSQVLVNTKEISARPAINIIELRTGRVNMADLIRQANVAMTNKKLVLIEAVLHDAIDNFGSPFYGTGTGIVPATLDAQLNYFRRIGAVTILGDNAAVSQLAPLTGMAINANSTQFSGNMIDERNNNGFIGKYNGCDVVSMTNTYDEGAIEPMLSADWLYILPGGVSADMRNLKVVNEGSVNAVPSQNIDDMVYEVRLDQWFGAAFIVGRKPNIGAYCIG